MWALHRDHRIGLAYISRNASTFISQVFPPIERVVSAYQHAVEMQEGGHLETVYPTLTPQIVSSYEAFIDHVLSGAYDPHWCHQMTWLKDSRGKLSHTHQHRFDDIGKFWSTYFPATPLQHLNRSGPVKSSTHKLTQLFSYYREDYEAWLTGSLILY